MAMNDSVERRIVALKWIIVLCVLLMMVDADAIMLSPSRFNYVFEPGRNVQDSFTILDAGNMTVSVDLFGELASYMNVSDEVIVKDGRGDVAFSLELPSELTPGVHEAEVVVSFSDDDIVAELVGQIRVWVPAQEYYLDESRNIRVDNDTIIVSEQLYNPGLSTDGAVSCIITQDDELVQEFHAPFKLDTLDTKTMKFTHTVRHGVYNIITMLSYANQSVVSEDFVAVGEPALVFSFLRNVYVFKDSLYVDVYNDYNLVAEDLWLDGTIMLDGEPVEKVSSDLFTLGPYKSRLVELPVNLSNGNYSLMLVSNKGDSYTADFNIDKSADAVAIEEIESGQQDTYSTPVLVQWVVSMVVLIILLGAGYYYYRRKQDEDYDIP